MPHHLPASPHCSKARPLRVAAGASRDHPRRAGPRLDVGSRAVAFAGLRTAFPRKGLRQKWNRISSRSGASCVTPRGTPAIELTGGRLS